MPRYLIIGVEGEAERWLIDCQRETVERIDVEDLGGSNAADVDIASNMCEARREGFSIVRGIDVAIASESRTGVSAHVLYADGSSDEAGGNFAPTVNDARRAGFRLVRGIDVAIACESRAAGIVHARFAGSAE
jgi:hypothetical protein